MTKPVDILVLCSDPELERCWTRTLTDTDTRLWQGASELTDDTSVDVIVTNRMFDSEDLPYPKLGSRLTAGEVGVVRVGSGPADVSLPDDCTQRELRLACQLLAEIVRLRRDRSRSHRLQHALAELARSDPLTGLPNRRAWEDELAIRIENQEAEPGGYCLVLFDLDHFKSVNDMFGHMAGDDVLRHVARQLDAQRNGSDFVARLGGDEFALLMVNRVVSQAAELIEMLRTSVCDGSPYTPITASAGYAFCAELRSEAIDNLFHAADDALRSAKAAGRDRSVAADTT